MTVRQTIRQKLLGNFKVVRHKFNKGLAEARNTGDEWLKLPLRLLSKLFIKTKLVDRRNFHYNYWLLACACL